MTPDSGFAQLKFRDPARGRALAAEAGRLAAQIGRSPISLMHVCGSHEQAIARFGLRAAFPSEVDLIMGPGCPVCVTDLPEVDEAVALAKSGVRVATYGDMLKVPGTVQSLADAQAEGAKVDVVYSVSQAVDLARSTGDEVVFFSTGFETTAVATAAVVLAPDRPKNLSILSAHKYILPAMEIVAEIPGTRIEGFLGAGHAAAITGWGIFEPFAETYGRPVVVAGFEPLDILAGLVKLLELVRDGRAEVANMYPRCVTKEGNLRAQEQLWKVFEMAGGNWRGIAWVPDGNLRIREEHAEADARRRFDIDLRLLDGRVPARVEDCLCGAILSGLASPFDCGLFGTECVPDRPVGACMVSSEGACRIWHQYGGRPDLKSVVLPEARP